MLQETEIKLIEAKTKDILKSVYRTDDFDIPVNLEKLAKYFNLEIENASFKNPEIVGLYKRSERKIFVNKDVVFSKKAFTIAHEIGHYILHKNKEKETFLRLDSLNIDIQEEKEEMEANWFAASLLMPKNIIKKYQQQINDLDLLAKMFGVSNTALLIRLKNISDYGN